MQDLALDGVCPAPSATLEKDYWKLDGSYEPFPDSPQNTSWGIWSNSMSDENGNFSVLPVIELSFQNAHKTAGLTFEFCPYGNNYCNHMLIQWYLDDAVIKEAEFYPAAWRCEYRCTVEKYNKLIITFYSTNKPYRYLKVQNIQHGINEYFSEDEIETASVLEEVDISALELSVNTLEFRLRTANDDFDIFNPKGLYNLLQKKQQLCVEGYVDGGLINFGYFYLDNWNDDEGETELTAQDAIGIMSNTTFKGGIYEGKKALDVIDEIMNDAGFGYSVDSRIGDMKISGWLPICTHREALQQVAFALGAYVDTSRGGMVRIRFGADEDVIYNIGMDRKAVGSSAALKEYISGVSITEHSYVLGTTVEELYKGNLYAGDNEITFSEPSVVTAVSGGTLKESGVNYCIVNMTADGEVIVKGKKYTDNTSVITVNADTVAAGEKENIKTVTDATLINNKNSLYVAQMLLNSYQKRIEQNLSFVLNRETVGSNASVEVYKDYFKNAVITKLETDLVNGFVTKAVVIGE
ncbi:MAG: hypothetical protein EGQ35_00360 [Clostridiales bacterium]|nr:hypothetical protein [Clostridiales bacterium]